MSGYSLHIISSTDDSNILGFNDSRKKPFTREYKREMGEKLKALRNAKGLSVEKAAELFGKSEGTIKAFERGDSLTGDNMVDLCRFYGCAISDFFPEGLLQYCIPNRKTIQMMETNDLLRVMKLRLCKVQHFTGPGHDCFRGHNDHYHGSGIFQEQGEQVH